MSAPSALKRIWKTVPLHRLQQGSKLTIRSRIPSLQVRVEPQWRDDGMARLDQVFLARSSDGSRPTGAVVQWNVQQNAAEVETSLGRQASHITMDLFHEDDAGSSSTMPEAEAHQGTTGCQGDEERNLEDKDESDTLRSPGAYLTIQTPESINLDIDLETGNIHVMSKVEGDVQLSTGDGNITVKKVRGHIVRLETKGPSNPMIHAQSTLEARDLSIYTTGRFRAKQCHGSNIEIVAACDNPSDESLIDTPDDGDDDEGSIIDISSLFVSGDGSAQIRCNTLERLRRRSVRIKSHHGAVHVETQSNGQTPIEQHPHTGMAYPIVELGGVNGCCEVFCKRTAAADTVTEEDTTAAAPPSDWNSCLLHVDSLLPDRINVLAADHGSIGVTLDRKIEADLRLASVPQSVVTEASATVADEEDTALLVQVLQHLPDDTKENVAALKDADTVSIQTSACTEGTSSIVSPNVVYRDGTVRNQSAEPDSRFDRRGAGKVNADAAAAQAFTGFSSEHQPDDAPQHSLLAVVGSEKITVETVSWIGAIARRYGLDEAEDRQLGRTASRRGREFVER